MEKVPVVAEGRQFLASASVIGNAAGAVIQLQLWDGEVPFGRAHIYPPYHSSMGAWLAALPDERRAEALLHLFARGELGVSPDEIVENYRLFLVDGKLPEYFPNDFAMPVHP